MQKVTSWISTAAKEFAKEHTNRILWTADLKLQNLLTFPAKNLIVGERVMPLNRKDELSFDCSFYKTDLPTFLRTDPCRQERATFCMLNTKRIKAMTELIKSVCSNYPDGDEMTIIVSIKLIEVQHRWTTINAKAAVISGLHHGQLFHFSDELGKKWRNFVE